MKFKVGLYYQWELPTSRIFKVKAFETVKLRLYADDTIDTVIHAVLLYRDGEECSWPAEYVAKRCKPVNKLVGLLSVGK